MDKRRIMSKTQNQSWILRPSYSVTTGLKLKIKKINYTTQTGPLLSKVDLRINLNPAFSYCNRLSCRPSAIMQQLSEKTRAFRAVMDLTPRPSIFPPHLPPETCHFRTVSRKIGWMVGTGERLTVVHSFLPPLSLSSFFFWSCLRAACLSSFTKGNEVYTQGRFVCFQHYAIIVKEKS